jgi:hypothetical protein
MMGMQAAGMATSALSALQGGSASGGGYLAEEIVPDSTDQAFIDETNKEAVAYRGMVGRGEMYENMATPLLRDSARKLDNIRKTTSASMQNIKSAEGGGVATGSTGIRAQLMGSGQELGESISGTRNVANLKRENLAGMQNYGFNVVKEERQLGGLASSAKLAQLGLDQQTKIIQGQALGDIAAMGGMMFAQYNQAKYRNNA